jgi:predicted secreted protein
MYRMFARFLFGLLLLAALTACARQEDKPKVLTEENYGEAIVLAVGEFLDVSLEGNPSTGYSWEMVQADRPVLSQVGEVDFQSANQRVGSPGRVTLHFQAVEPGEQKLELIYRRPWEMDTPPLLVYEVFVEVK